MNTDGQNSNVGGMAGANTGDVDAVAAATAVSAIGSSENVNNNSSNGKAGGGGNEGKTNASAVDDSLVDPELNQQSTDERAKAEDNDDDDDQINQIEDDNDNIVAAAAAAAASNDMNYLANMHAVENHMQNVLGNAGAQGGAGPDGPGPGASVGGHGMLHANAQGAPGKDIEMGGSGHDANDADYNDDGDDDDDDDNKLSSKTAIDAVVESSKVKKSVSNTKRAAQNRAAQRAFRQRRKTRIEQLENVELLYKAALQDVERLQAENDALKKKLTEINSK